MKNFYSKMFLLLIAAVTLSFTANAQTYKEDPKYGATPEQREANVLKLNYFNDAYNNKDYNAAVKYLQELIVAAPKSSQNLYINGINIYRNKVMSATSVAEKAVYVDSLMMLYDLRMEHFGDDVKRGRKYVAGIKARDFMDLKPTDKIGIKKHFEEAIKIGAHEIDMELINLYFFALAEDYKSDNIETSALLDEYDTLSKIYDADKSPEAAELRKQFDALFIASGAANCENLEKVFKPQIEANKTDIALLEKTFSLLMRNNCVSPFQVEVGELLYKAKPSSQIALSLAAGFEASKNFAKARTYLNEAISIETDPEMKSNLALRIAGGEFSQESYKTAAEWARQAIDLNPNNGYAYIILAQAYAVGSSKSCSETFDKQTVFWLVVDNLLKAKDLLASDANQVANIDTQIASSRGYWPSNEDTFFRSVEPGKSYNVSCGWISGRTTVRTIR